MLKIVYNNMIIDVLPQNQFLRYLPKSKRNIMCERENANGILGSDGNTIYHLAGTDYTFVDTVKSVQAIEIEEEEYNNLRTQMMRQEQQNLDLREEVESLKETISKQNSLLEQLLSKLS